MKIDEQKVKEIIKGIKEGTASKLELKNALGGEKLEEIFDASTLEALFNNIISIFDGFHSTSWFDAWVGDLQDSGNAFVQVLTRNVMADIRAKEMEADFLGSIPMEASIVEAGDTGKPYISTDSIASRKLDAIISRVIEKVEK